MHNAPPQLETLVMTSAIETPQLLFLKVQNHDIRLFQTLCSLLAWLREPSIGIIVLCDGTMASFDFSPIVSYARKLGKTIEVLRFKESDDVMAYGKGYGEGQVMRYAIEHSVHLSENTNFFKVTGRTYVRNFQSICSSLVVESVAFSTMDNQLRRNPLSRVRHWISVNVLMRSANADTSKALWTQFYKMNVGFYKKHLLESYRNVRDNDGYYLEHAFYDSLNNVSYASIAESIDVIGISGTSGRPYSAENFSYEIRKQAIAFLSTSTSVQ